MIRYSAWEQHAEIGLRNRLTCEEGAAKTRWGGWPRSGSGQMIFGVHAIIRQQYNSGNCDYRLCDSAADRADHVGFHPG